MRIFQDEIYQKAETYIRIVRLDRYEVEYKTTTGDPKGDAASEVMPKKEFCRLLKGMVLITPARKEQGEPGPVKAVKKSAPARKRTGPKR